MGISKTELFDDAQNEIARVAKVLSHPARVAILQYISRQDACICSDLVQETGLAQATISQHLAEIRKVGLLKGNIQGKNRCYCIDRERWEALQSLFSEFFSRIQVQCC